jgi:hypothetical protein
VNVKVDGILKDYEKLGFNPAVAGVLSSLYPELESINIMMPKFYRWHGRRCIVLVMPVFKKGVKRNALVKFTDDGELMVVPWRSLRREK